MEKKVITPISRFVVYIIAYLFTAIISARIIASTHVYDPGWVTVISFLFIGIPFFIGGIVVMTILLRKKVRWYIEIISAIVILILMISTYSILIHRNGLPGESWVYNEELSKLYKLSLGSIDEHEQYRVYLGKTTIQGREAAIYRYERGWGEWRPIETGIEKDGKLFIDNWRVYPTQYIGISHLGENPMGSGQVIYVDHLTTMAEEYTLYLKNDTGDFISNLSSYNATVGDILAFFGEWQNGPEGICGDHDCDLLIVDKIEVVEVLS
ncbi:MAG: hypothetical protein NTV74_07235 [Euryarchaeota archaeon]|nr:hypothetical protein [Euryarchaeota archaeon]